MILSTYLEEFEKIITGSISRYEEILDGLLEPIYIEERKYFEEFSTMQTQILLIESEDD